MALGLPVCWGQDLVLDTSQASFLLPEVMGSDNCPVGAALSVSTDTSVPAKQCPPLCPRFLPELSGTQLEVLHFSSSPTRAGAQAVSAELGNKSRDKCAKTKPVCAQPGLCLVRLDPAEAKNR